jgi:hypothetical protein
LDLTQRQRDAVLVRESHLIVGGNASYRGDLVAARAHLEQSLEVSAVPQSTTTLLTGRLHPGITSYAWLLRPLWELGDADQAQRRCQEALALAQQLGHRPSLALVYYFAAMLSQSRRDAAATYARADALMALATAQGLVHRVEQGHILRGWALAMLGDAAAAGSPRVLTPRTCKKLRRSLKLMIHWRTGPCFPARRRAPRGCRIAVAQPQARKAGVTLNFRWSAMILSDHGVLLEQLSHF